MTNTDALAYSEFQPKTEVTTVNELLERVNDFSKRMIERVKVEKETEEVDDNLTEEERHEIGRTLLDDQGKIKFRPLDFPDTDIVLQIVLDPPRRSFEYMATMQRTEREQWLAWMTDEKKFPVGYAQVDQYFAALEAIILGCNKKKPEESWRDVFSVPFDGRAQYLDEVMGLLVTYYTQKRFFSVTDSEKSPAD